MKSEWPHPALHVFIAVVCVNVVFISHVLDTSSSIITGWCEEWLKCTLHSKLRYTVLSWWWRQQIPPNTVMYLPDHKVPHPRNMKFHSLPLESKPHWLWKYYVSLTKTGQRKMYNICPLTPVTNLSTYMTVINNILKNIWILYCRHNEYTTSCF